MAAGLNALTVEGFSQPPGVLWGPSKSPQFGSDAALNSQELWRWAKAELDPNQIAGAGGVSEILSKIQV